MKKRVFALSLAAIILLSGCSGVSQESYNSLLEENSRLQSEILNLKETNDNSEDNNGEYAMPKDHVKRIAKVLGLAESACVSHNEVNSLDIMTPYNIKSTYEIWAYEKAGDYQVKSICDISSDNTVQQKAAFIFYFWRLSMAETFENAIETGCENVVTIINDNKGIPIAVWLVYKENGEFIHDMDIVDTSVLAVFDEVMEDRDTWYPQIDETSKPLPDSTVSLPTDSRPTGSRPTGSGSTSTVEKPVESQTPPVQDTVTTGERNALKKAQSYLDTMPFSHDGLIEQLKYSGFTNNEATYGANNVGADWNEQALKKAKSYLDTMPFSYNGLIEQLEYSKFTHEQAVYGANRCGADWNEQAAKKAKSYLDIMAFSKDGLIKQLEYSGFTHEQAVYGAAQNGY